MNQPESISPIQWMRRLSEARSSTSSRYFAFYSSVVDAITTDPALMSAPFDDHLVHRGDGVFETVKCVNGAIYLLDRHLDRLAASAGRIGLQLRAKSEITDIVKATVRAGGRRDCLIRVIASRGPGGMGVNPYECPASALYVLAHELPPSFMVAHPGGARVISSKIPVKAGYFATIKSCNYLPNALMKKEAIDAGVDFSVAFDEHDCIAEGATENLGLLTSKGELHVPKLDRILGGTTMLRVMELVRAQLPAKHAAISREDMMNAAEIYIFGTTPDVTAVVEFDGHAIGDGKPGLVFNMLSGLLLKDIAESRDHLINL